KISPQKRASVPLAGQLDGTQQARSCGGTNDRCRRKAAFNRALAAEKLRRFITSFSIFPFFKRGPDVWCFRWREGGPDGRKIHRRIVLGTADALKSIASARKAVIGLKREINLHDVRTRRESITLADLSRHFQQRELADRNL